MLNMSGMEGLFFIKVITMKKMIGVMQALLLFASIHILIAWVAERKSIRTKQEALELPLTSTSTAKNIDKQNPSAFNGAAFMMNLPRKID